MTSFLMIDLSYSYFNKLEKAENTRINHHSLRKAKTNFLQKSVKNKCIKSLKWGIQA